MDTHKQQDNSVCFAEVLKNPGSPTQYYNKNTTDSRIMIYWQGAKIYLPDNFQPELLLKVLRVIKQL